MALSSDMVASYIRPRKTMRSVLQRGESEGYALGILMVSCVVIFVARWPSLAREAHLDPSIPLQARMGGALMALVMIAPLLLYALAALSHVVAKVFRGKGDFFAARLALFWSLFVVTPLFLFVGLVDGFIGKGPESSAAQFILLAAFLYIWGASLIEAETPQPDFVRDA